MVLWKQNQTSVFRDAASWALPNRLGSKEKRKRLHLKCIALTYPGAAEADSHFTWHLKPCEECDAFFP